MSGRFLPRWVSIAEVVGFYGLALAVIWGRGEGKRPTLLVLAALAATLCVVSNRIHGDSLHRIGFTRAEFAPALKKLLLVAVPLALPLYARAFWRGFEGDWNLWFSVLGYPVWGLVQEYVLLGFIANRLEDSGVKRTLVPWINGALFAAIHYPNPVLMLATVIAGVLFTSVYLRHRNLFAPALVHALIGIGLSFAFGDVQGIMSVGPGYTARLGTLPPPPAF